MGNNRKSGKYVVGVDLGGTKILAGVVDGDGKIAALAKRPTKASGGVEKVVERIARTVKEAVEAAHLDLSDVAAVCSGTPGPADAERGIVYVAPNLPGWQNVPLADLLSHELRVPVFVENDVNLGTVGEHALGAGKGIDDMVGIFVGTGIGGGVVLGGELWQGWRGSAGEVGHMILLADGPVCGCGNRGCAEALASRTAIERDILAAIQAGRETLVPRLMEQEGRERLTSGVLAEALHRGDPLVGEVITRAQYYLAMLAGSIVNFIDPEMVVFGGGVVEALGESFVDPVREVAYQYFVNKRKARSVKIVPARLGDQAAVLGAGVQARLRLGEH